LREALPHLIHIKAGAPQATPLRATLALLGAETGAGAPGEAVIVDRLAGIADPRIGRAMRRFQADVAADWTVASLAAVAGMSRSFAEQFRMRVGMAPLDYLTRWRMYRVRRALFETDPGFAEIAERNGYRSRTSCSQSFKRLYSYPPGHLRSPGDASAHV
jgi:transcriptional regulator GlxA family with amidase domain